MIAKKRDRRRMNYENPDKHFKQKSEIPFPRFSFCLLLYKYSTLLLELLLPYNFLRFSLSLSLFLCLSLSSLCLSVSLSLSLSLPLSLSLSLSLSLLVFLPFHEVSLARSEGVMKPSHPNCSMSPGPCAASCPRGRLSP